ncbi:MAG: hypothetical protein AAF533_12655 [Acidobacteriota bacterium]
MTMSSPRLTLAVLLAAAFLAAGTPALAGDYDLVALAAPRPPQDLGTSGPLTLTYQVQEIFTGDPGGLTVVVTHEGLSRNQRERLGREERFILLAHADPETPGRFIGPAPLRATQSAISSFRSWSAPADVRPPQPLDSVVAGAQGGATLTDGAVIEHVSADPPPPVTTPPTTPAPIVVETAPPAPPAPAPPTPSHSAEPVVVSQSPPPPAPVSASSRYAPAPVRPASPAPNGNNWGGMVIIDTVRVGGGANAPTPQSMATPQYVIKDGRFQRLPSDVAPGTFDASGQAVARPVTPPAPVSGQVSGTVTTTPWSSSTGTTTTSSMATPPRPTGATNPHAPLMHDSRLQPTKAPGLPPAPPTGKVLGTPLKERTDLQRVTGDD